MKTLLNYTELVTFKNYEERLDYLIQNGTPFQKTFGGLRELNQIFYSSSEWKSVRNSVIVRDLGNDLGVEGLMINGIIYVHHMNPITPEVLLNNVSLALDPEYLITSSFNTHQMIHYGKEKVNNYGIVNRFPGDTKLW